MRTWQRQRASAGFWEINAHQQLPNALGTPGQQSISLKGHDSTIEAIRNVKHSPPWTTGDERSAPDRVRCHPRRRACEPGPGARIKSSSGVATCPAKDHIRYGIRRPDHERTSAGCCGIIMHVSKIRAGACPAEDFPDIWDEDVWLVVAMEIYISQNNHSPV
ncbi:hypothetical protein VTN02DRAFT_1860 [Thermoascus thermophilus]